MDCPKCGTHNIDGAERCRMCGHSFIAQKVPAGPSKTCQFCKTANDPEAPFCAGCGRYLGSVEMEKTLKQERQKKEYVRTYDDYAASAKRSARANIGGIVLILVAAIVLADAVITIAIVLPDYSTIGNDNPAIKTAINNLVTCQAIRIVFIVLAFMGGSFAVRKQNWGFAMVGGVMGVLAVMTGLLWLVFPIWALIELVLFCAAIVSIVMVGISRREFLLA